MAVNDVAQAQIEGLATLLVLDEEIRSLTNIREFGFFSTNETHRLIPYHTAFLWQLKEFIGPQLMTQSGTAEIDSHALDNQWLMQKINLIRTSPQAKEIHQLGQEDIDSTIAGIVWPESLPHYLLWCPLLSKTNQLSGGLIFFRETPFTEAEIKMLRWLISSYQYTWLVLAKPAKQVHWQKFKEKPYLAAIIFVILAILFFPMRLTVFAEGTVVPKEPVLINAPMQGVIESFAVSPGDHVKPGQLLLTFDKTDLQAAADVSQKDLLLTKEKLRTVINEGFSNKESRAEIPVVQAQLAIDQAHLDYANEMLAKTNVTTPIAGVVIFDSKEDWVGQPLQTGERILVIANPEQTELKITLPVANTIQLAVGNKGEFFPFGELNPLTIQLKTLGYNAKLSPSKILAYQLVGAFTETDAQPQLGAQGTVKIYGQHVPFIYYLIRRPLQALRQTLGI